MHQEVFRLVLAVLLLAVFTGCGSTPQARPAPNAAAAPQARAELSVEDGSLHAVLRRASVTVLKDGQIAGSGAFIDERGLVLTAAHVANPADRVFQVVLPDGKTVVAARLVARDLGHDLALLRAVVAGPVAYLPLAESMPPAGASIFVVTAPLFYTDTLLPGRVARDRPGFTLLGGLDTYVASYIIAADTPKGASGGCWVNARGEIVGVQSAFIGDDAGSLGLAFIGSVNQARRLVAAGRDVPASTLGVELVALRSQTPGYVGRFPAGSAGAAIHRIKPGSPAEAAGLPRESLITHLNDQPVHDLDTLLTALRRFEPGQTVTLRVVLPDSHAPQSYAVTLGAVAW